MTEYNNRFEIIYSQKVPAQMLSYIKIIVDKKTGVNYLFHEHGYCGGLTPLLNQDGKPVVSPVLNK